LIEELQPFRIMENRDIKLHCGINIVWGMDSEGEDIDLLVGHSVGKTLFCRLLRYGLGDATYAPEDFQNSVEKVLPGAYVGLEVMVQGQVWAIARPLCQVQPGAPGKRRNHRRDYALVGSSLEDLFASDKERGFKAYEKALSTLCECCLPQGFDEGEMRPFVWKDLLQWFTRDQETRFQDVTLWRSRKSRTGSPIDQELGDLLMRCVLGLVDVEEARIAVKLREKEREVREATARNEANRKIMWTVAQQLTYRHAGLWPERPDDADAGKSLFTVPVILNKELEKLKSLWNKAKQELKGIEQQECSAYETWSEVEKRARALEAQIGAHKNTDSMHDEELRDICWLKNELKKLKDDRCPYCDELFGLNTKIIDRLNEEDEIRHASEARRKQIMEERNCKCSQRQEELEHMQPRRDELTSNFHAIRLSKEQKNSEIESLRVSIRVAEQELEDLNRHLAGVKAVDAHRADPKSPLPIINIEGLTHDVALLTSALTELRLEREQKIKNVRIAYNVVVRDVLNEHFSGILELDEGHLHFGLDTGRGQEGEAVQTLTVLLVDFCTLGLGISGKVVLPGILIHDSPREADLQGVVYSRLFDYMERLTVKTGGETSAPFQYIITTTTPPPEVFRVSGRVVLKLSARSDTELLLQRRIPNNH
jgi:hypothetical protein